MSKIKNGGIDQYGAEPFEQQQFGTAGVEWVKTNSMEIVSYCWTIFQLQLPSTQVSLRSQKFIVKYRLSDTWYCKYA